MKLNVPFYRQENNTDCGPIALKMILDYFEKNNTYTKETITTLVDSDASGVTWTMGIAYASAALGFPTEIYTAHLGMNERNYDLEYYKKNADNIERAKKKLESLQRKARESGAHIEQRKLSFNEITEKISKNCLAIVLLDWSKITKTEKFIGHFVPVVGYDDKNVYVHNQGLQDPEAFKAIEKELFEKARTAKGTDEDILFIHQNESKKLIPQSNRF